MIITFSQIITQLNKLSVTYEISNKNQYDSYQFASIKNKIKKGFYYLEKEYIEHAAEIYDSIILTNANEIQYNNSNTIIHLEQPQLIHYKLATLFSEAKKEGIHKTAIVSDKAKVSPTAYIGPYCVIEEAIIEEGVQLLNNIIVRDKTRIKSNTIIEANSIIGAKGMSWIWDAEGKRILQPQLGGVDIGKDCVIGTDITIVRGTLSENTRIGDNCIISHGTKIGHGCVFEDYVHTANNVSLAGNAHVGERTFLGSGCTISSNVIVKDNCIVGAGAVLNKSIEESYVTLVGVPAKILKRKNYLDKPKGAPKPFKK